MQQIQSNNSVLQLDDEFKLWCTLTDEEAEKHLDNYKNWMMKGYVANRVQVEEAFHIISKDIPISLGANGDVASLVCGPAVPYCYKSNLCTWASFFIILYIARAETVVDVFGMAIFPHGHCLVKVLCVFVLFAGLSMWYEFKAAMYVLPSQAIACGGNLEGRGSFNWWVTKMMVISFFYRVDILTTAVFIGRVTKSCGTCQELDARWAQATARSPLQHIPVLGGLPFHDVVQFGAVIMFSQFLYALAYSFPLSPNLCNGFPKSHENDDDFRRVDYRMCSIGKGEHLEGDWPDRPKDEQKTKALDDCLLIPPTSRSLQFEEEEARDVKYARLRSYLAEQQERNGIPDTYEMRLARHRRARIANFHAFMREDMGYGRAVQALVESGRMNLPQWQDDIYLKEAEQNWETYRIVEEMRRTNFRFFLFALQSFFIPNLQVTFFGIARSHLSIWTNATRKPIPWYFTYSFSFTVSSTIICALIGMNYLLYECRSVDFHRQFAFNAIKRFKQSANKEDNHRLRWEGHRMERRARNSNLWNKALVAFFIIFYLYIAVKVYMVMFVCESGMYNLHMPWAQGGCLPIDEIEFVECDPHDQLFNQRKSYSQMLKSIGYKHGAKFRWE